VANSELFEAVRLAAGNKTLLERLRRILDEAEAEMAGLADSCEACGQCCDFDARGHKLYVSTGELAVLALHAEIFRPRRGRCSYQQGARCGARAARPLGCRLFYCKFPAGFTDTNAYEDHHRRIRALHREANVPYHYVELTGALAEVSAMGGLNSPESGQVFV
jgi:Fe-S-cluster containining protein